MKTADIQKIRKQNLRAEFAVKVMRYVYGRPDRATVVKSGIADVAAGRAYLDAHQTAEFPRTDVTVAAVLGLWDAYVVDRDHVEALREDSQRKMCREFDQRNAERNARFEAFLPAFAGIEVTGPAGSKVDLAEHIRVFMCEGASQSIMFREAELAAIAARIREAQSAALDAGGGWAGPIDTGIAKVDPLAVLKAKLADMEVQRPAAGRMRIGSFDDGFVYAVRVLQAWVQEQEA